MQRPGLFKAAVWLVPLLDTKRYNKLLASNGWMAEYGNPDTDDWEYIQIWSPYHNPSKDTDCPKVFFATSTRDDRVHPDHARKIVARMTEMEKPVYYYEKPRVATRLRPISTSALTYRRLTMPICG